MAESYVSPVYNIIRVPVGKIQANAYNPNHIATPEFELLKRSIIEDGYTMPIVCYYLSDIDRYEIVDGYHRFLVMKTCEQIAEREGYCLPVSVINKPLTERMASTIRHNRARGVHSIDLMVNIVKQLTEAGLSDNWIMKNIGMDKDELLRLKQISGLASLFTEREFSTSWDSDDLFSDMESEEEPYDESYFDDENKSDDKDESTNESVATKEKDEASGADEKSDS